MANIPLFDFSSPERDSDAENANQFTQAALARHKQEGLELAVRARWAALAVVAVLLPILNPQFEMIYPMCLLGLIALNGWVLRRVGRVGRSTSEFFFIIVDIALVTFVLLFPNPLVLEEWPTALIFEFNAFLYFFVILMLGGLSYSWRTVMAVGHWTVGMWVIGSCLIWWFGDVYPEMSEAVSSAFPDEPFLASLVDPNVMQWERRLQEVVVFLICTYILALSMRRFERLVLGNAGLERARTNLSRYFSTTMVNELSTNDEPLKQIRTQDVAVMFVDIVGFTAWSANREPREVIDLLRQFHGLMEGEVFAHGGTLDKYLGDGLMATFGTPVTSDTDATRALQCARAMGDAVKRWNTQRAANGDGAIEASFGVHYGPVVMGDIGANRLEFAVIGNTVNVASRLEALTRQLATTLVISDDFRTRVIVESSADNPDLAGFVQREGQAIRGLDQAQTVWMQAR
ncbi:adenylate/guanylate cyclase domain-containing protein [Pseudosulfitobacter sp. SM2401]|uniref:adenylate/guanylate cyclase domain-containing protein n=1 Tax=Pseudosulfitobacter sp. SM2401 TaxID=3350098 RepID=UPI0036F40A17